MNHELPDVQARFRKGIGTRGRGIKLSIYIESFKKLEFQKKISPSALSTIPKSLAVWITNKLWKILKEMGIPDLLTYLLRNIYAGKEATVRTGHGTADWFQIEKRVSRLYIVTLLIQLMCRVHHEKYWPGWSTSGNQDCPEKYQ